MPHARGRHIDNPVKDQGSRKGKVQQKTDQARPRGAKLAAQETLTRQGGAAGRHGPAQSRHPGERGGVTADSAAGAPADRRKSKAVDREGVRQAVGRTAKPSPDAARPAQRRGTTRSRTTRAR
jgi:hypothetical protein